jgi:hypothetical protein
LKVEDFHPFVVSDNAWRLKCQQLFGQFLQIVNLVTSPIGMSFALQQPILSQSVPIVKFSKAHRADKISGSVVQVSCLRHI